MKKNHPRFLMILLVAASVLLLACAVFLYYFDSLYRLLDRSEITGNPSIPAIELANPDEIVSPTPQESSTSMTAAIGTAASIETTAATTATTVPTLSTIPIPSSKYVYNVLLIGTDRQGSETTGRSDAMIVFSIDRKNREIRLASLMRGLYVQVEGHGFAMLNNAYSWGGSRLLRQTIEENLRLRVSDYVVADFSSFSKAVDLAGGVDIALTAKEADHLAEFFPDRGLAEGLTHMDGELALTYARIRRIDSDYQRTARQRKIITNLISQMVTKSPAELDAMARQILPLLKTNISASKMIELVIGSPQYAGYRVKELMLPVRGSFETIVINGMQVVSFDVDANIRALHEFLYPD